MSWYALLVLVGFIVTINCATPQESLNNQNNAELVAALAREDDAQQEKRAWKSLAAGWGKRGWQDLQSSGWGKRGWQDLQSSGWGKRGWQDLQSSGWGKRGWQDLQSSGWGKRGWQDLQSSGWGKRGWQDLQSSGWGKRGEDTTDMRDKAELDDDMKRSWDTIQHGSGKRTADWSSFRGSWGKRDPAWQNLKGLWGKRNYFMEAFDPDLNNIDVEGRRE